MPFTKGTTPDRLKDKGIPQSFIDQWIEVFNSVLDKSNDEGKAYRQANSVMSKALHKAGYRKGKEGKWSKEADEQEAILFSPPPTRLVILEEEGSSLEKHLKEGMRVQGVALVDDAVSQLGGWERYYSKEFNDRCIEHTENFMSRGYPVTVFNTHASALGGGFFSAGTEKNPIGKVEKLYREGDKVMYQMFISPTQEGRDVIQLVHDGVMNPTSVRIYDYKARSEKLPAQSEDEESESIMVLEDGYIGGIDFCDMPGVPEAGITKVVEKLVFGQQIQEETMDWNEVTLEGLKENRPELLQSYVVETVQGLLAERETLKAQVAELESKVADSSKVDALQAELSAKDAEIQLWESAATPIVKEVAKQLKDVPQEERAAKAEEIRSKAIATVLAEVNSTASGSNEEEDGDIGDKTEAKVPEEMTEAFGDQMLKLARFIR